VDFSSQQFADAVVAAPAGRIDHPAAQAFESGVMPLLSTAGTGGAVVLDFARVEYISSAGLRVLMVASKEARTRGLGIGVAGLRPVVAEIFAISRFHAVVGVYPTVREALERLAPAALAGYDSGPGQASA
jgi:anti-sigma B factor antagonist/stage II sporulation protein AA (anti-sigma F factor antagonist)